MKNLFFAMIAVFSFILLQSCNKDHTDPVIKSDSYGIQSSWCQEIDDYVANNYPSFAIEQVNFQSVATAISPPIDLYLVTVAGDTGSGQTSLCLIFDEDCVFFMESPDCPE